MRSVDFLKIKIVENQEEQLKAFLVRGIVYMHGQNCPFDEEFDLNDFTSTQIIGLVGTEPVLTARIRYFGDFAKFERLAVRDAYRGMGYGHQLLKYMIECARKKGYQKVYLHAQARLQSFYEGYGFKRIGKDFEFSEHDYIEMFSYLDPKEDRIKLSSGAMVTNRPEMAWDRPGPLEAAPTSAFVHDTEIVAISTPIKGFE